MRGFVVYGIQHPSMKGSIPLLKNEFQA